MPASPNLFKVLTAEDPKSLLEDEIGCMTGIFQIFDRSQAFTGRRYGSKRVTSAADQSLSVSACESPRHDRSNSNPYWMFEDNAAVAAQKVDNNLEQSKGAVDHQSRDHHRAYSDSSDIFTKSFKAQGGGGGVLDRHLTDQKDHDQFVEQELSNSQEEGEEDHVPTLVCSNSSQEEEEEEESNNSNRLMKSVQDLVVDRSSSSVPHSKEYPKPPPLLVVSSREMCAAAATPEGSGGSSRQHCNSKDVQKLPSSLDIRDVVRASFHRERPRDSSGKEKPRASVDLGHGSSSCSTNVQSKSLPRSSSVNGRVDGFRMSVDGREELLWSSSASAVDHARSTGGRGSRMLVGDWKNGLQNSSTVESTPPQMSAALREKDNIQSSSKACVDGGRELPRISVDRNCFTKRSSCPAIDGKDHAAAATRLTVELKEDPRLSVSKDERRGGVFVDARDYHQHYSSPRLLLPGLNATTTTVRYPHESKDPSTTTTTTAAAFDFRESLRAADFKDLLRASQKVRGTTTDAPRFSVDGTRDPPHVHLSPRLSVDGRDSPRACGIPPRLKLDGRDATRAHGKLSSRSDGGGAAAFLQLKKENNAAERDHQGQGEAHRRIPNVVARLMGLEELPSSDPGSQAHPAKVADYHTLVKPPSSSSSSSSSRSEARLLQGLLQYTPATVVSPPLPPPPSQSDDYNYKQQQVVVREGFQQLSSKSSSCSSQKEMRVPLPSHLHHLHYYGGEEEEEIPLQYPPPLEERFWIHHAQEKSRDHPEVKSPTHHQVQYHPHDEAFQEQRWQCLPSQTPAPQLSDHVVLTALKHTHEEKTTQPLGEEEPLYGLMDQEMHQLRLKNSVQGRKLLRHILHAMQLKGLLHHPPGRNRKQSSEDVKAAAAVTQQQQQQLQVPKATTVEESKSRMQALKQQFLPSPRLTTAAVRKRGNSLVPAETCKDNKDNKKTVATQQQQDQQHHLPMMMTMETNLLQELVVNSSNEEQINSCCSVQQDDGPIMLGNIPDTLIIVPKPITEMEDDNIITTAITTLSSSSPPAPAQTGDLDCVSSQSSSSARSAVTSSVQTSTETEYPQSSSTCSNGVVATMTSKRENGDTAAANGRTSRVQTQSSSGSSSLREPNGSSSSDTEAVAVVTPRMSRKERIAARSSKSSQLDAAAAASQGGGRDVSPARSPRLLTSSPLAQVGKPRLTFLIKEANPLKPGLLSPGRCAGGGSSSSGPPQLVESSGSKASSWSTKSFMVKDREETKATLFTLRAQSTKQEFLKGRASGGPDTPRPLRRSSSDSKLISRITEKLTATDATAAVAAVSTRTAAAQAGGAQGGRILIPAEVTISRSKRKTGKPNNPTPKCRISSSSSSPSSCALDTTTETLVSAAAADPSTKEKINKFPNGVTGPAVMAMAADEHTNWDQSNDSDLMMLESIHCANIALAESRLLELPTATTVMPENLVTTSKNVSSVRKALRVTSAEKLELLQATSIQKPSTPIAVEDTVNHGEEDGGGDSHAHLASNQVTSSPIERLCKSEQLDAELDERGSSISEVLTPRGVSVKKTYESGHELGPADQLVEQPSPVSVLDNFHFQEEDLTPSPSKTSRGTLDSLQDAFDESLHRDHLEEAKAALKGLADIRSRDLCNQQQDYLCHNNKQSVEIRVPIDNAQQAGTHYSLAGNNNTVVHGICLWSKDEEREYVRDMLVVSRVITEDDDDDDDDTSSSGINNCHLQWGRSSGYNNIMDVNQFDDLEARWRRRQQQRASSFNNTKENDFFLFERHQTCLENEAVGRRVLFDGTNEILVQKLDPVKFNPLPWIGGHNRPQPQEKPSGQQLIQQVWDELQDVPCVASEDVCDTLYTILHKDLRNTEKKWSDMDGEVSEVSLDLERMIVKDLIDEIVKDLTVQATTATTTTTTTTNTQLIDEAAAAATRRQLFAHQELLVTAGC